MNTTQVTKPLQQEPLKKEHLQQEHSRQARRRFLQKLGLLAAATTTSGYTLLEVSSKAQAADESVTEGASAARRWGLLIDTSKCSSGCDACVRGCNSEHGIDDSGDNATRAQWIRKIDLEDNLTGKQSSVPVMCQHCDSAPCVDVCPTGASFKRDDGIVLVNKHTCIGCRYCMMACPYKARSFIHEVLTDQKPSAPRGKGTVESCTLCVHRVDRVYTNHGNNQESNQESNHESNVNSNSADSQPACAVACTDEAHSAILFGDLNDPQSQISAKINEIGASQVRADLQLNTGVRYHGL